MDISDSSKLLKTFNLNKALECLSCNEDTNAIDSMYTKSTGCESSNQYTYTKSIFEDSFLETYSEKNIFYEFDRSKISEKMPELTSQEIYSKVESNFKTQNIKVCFFNETWLEFAVNLENYIKEMLKVCLEAYQSKQSTLKDGTFIELYEISNKEYGTIKNYNSSVSAVLSNTFFIIRNKSNEVTLLVKFRDLSAYVTMNIEDNLETILTKINKTQVFSRFFDVDNYFFSSIVTVKNNETECELNFNLKIRFLPSEKLNLKNKVFLDTPSVSKTVQDREFIVGIVDKKGKVSKKELVIDNDKVTIRKSELEIKKKTIINKIKLFIDKKNKRLDIPFCSIMALKKLENSSRLEITFREKKKSMFIIIEGDSEGKILHIYSKISSLINIPKLTI